jgi:hypothetical protein
VILDRSDIVRHPLVQAIVNAYEISEPAEAAGPAGVKDPEPDRPPPAGDSASG